MAEDNKDRSTMYIFAKGLDKVVNVLAVIMILILLLYAGHSLWYNHSLQNNSFLPEELAKYRPDGRKPSLSDLKEINPDVVGWITIDNTHIDYPVVQGKDDIEYLNKSVLGEFSLAGSIFLSAENRPDFSDPYNMAYGHHIEGGAMLTDVLEFRNASFFKTHKTGTLWYPNDGDRTRADKIEIFAALNIGGSDEVVYCNPRDVTKEKLKGVTDYITSKAVQKRKPKLGEEGRVIGLSTCEDAVSYDRVLLFGTLRAMTDEEIKAAQAKEQKGAASEDENSKWFTSLRCIMLIPLLIIILIIIYMLRKRQKQKKIEKK